LSPKLPSVAVFPVKGSLKRGGDEEYFRLSPLLKGVDRRDRGKEGMEAGGKSGGRKNEGNPPTLLAGKCCTPRAFETVGLMKKRMKEDPKKNHAEGSRKHPVEEKKK